MRLVRKYRCAVLLLLTMLALPAQAVVFSLDAPQAPKNAGIKIDVLAADADQLGAFQFTLFYDHLSLALESADWAGGAAGLLETSVKAPGQLRIKAVNNQPPPAGKAFITVKGRTLKSGSSAIAFVDFRAWSSGVPIIELPAQGETATITVGGFNWLWIAIGVAAVLILSVGFWFWRRSARKNQVGSA